MSGHGEGNALFGSGVVHGGAVPVAGEVRMDQVWERIEAWLAANIPSITAGLNPPASSRELIKTERLLGLRFPEDLRQSYLRHNGQCGRSHGLFTGNPWYPLEEVRNDWQMRQDKLDSGEFKGERSCADGVTVRTDWWHPRWIPITYMDCERHYVDLAPGPEGRVGQVVGVWHDGWARAVVAGSFREWLTDFANDLETGWIVVCKDIGELEFIEQLRAMLVRRADRCRMRAWPVVLKLARQFGWEPAGTRPPRDVRVADWNATDYTTYAGQQVTEPDALALAAALGRALAAIPKGDRAKPPKGASREVRYFTGYYRRGLADFAKFCKRGAFRIIYDPDES
jgi:cell wall assembly regulator SMI1